MPLYTYKCPACGNEEERIVSVDKHGEETEEQRCNRQLSLQETREPAESLVRGYAGGQKAIDALPDAVVPAFCSGRMTRTGIELTARMPFAWKF